MQRSELSRQALESGQLIEEFAEQRLADKAGAPEDFATRLRRHHGRARVLRRPLGPAAADRRGALRKGARRARRDGSTGSCSARPARPRRQTLDLKLADGTQDARGRQRLPLRRRADRRDRRGPAGAHDQCLDARAGPALRPAAAAGRGGRRAGRRAAEPPHHAPGAGADRRERADRARRLRRAPRSRRAPTSSGSWRCASSRWRGSCRRRASTSATS